MINPEKRGILDYRFVNSLVLTPMEVKIIVR